MPTIHTYDARTREYLKTVDWTPPNEWVALPADATTIEPPSQREGYARVLNLVGDTWEYIEDHRGERGYSKGQHINIMALGKLPDDWSLTPPEPSEDRKREQYRRDILNQLSQIDIKSVRPLRAKLSGVATIDDDNLLISLEEQAVELRKQLASISL